MKTTTIVLSDLIVPSSLNFLILDDDKSINETIKEFLEFLGCNGNFYQALNLHQAKTILEANEIHYILSDWKLPDGEGVSLLKAIRKSMNYSNTPFVMISGKDDIDSIIKCSKFGCSDYLTKPFTIDEFKQKLVQGWKTHIITRIAAFERLQIQFYEQQEEIKTLRGIINQIKAA
jgi:two-component system chemotaxis response regulator CheY